MRFSLPLRLKAPLVALVCGLAATLMDYQLNLHFDLARHQEELEERADSNGRRLAKLATSLLNQEGGLAVLQADVQGTEELPVLENAGIVNKDGFIMAGSPVFLKDRDVKTTPLVAVAALIPGSGGKAVVCPGESEAITLSAHPFPMAGGETGWVLLKFNRAPAMAAALEDARMELKWMASALGLLSLVLWALLHFTFANRLARLAKSVKALGEGQPAPPELPRGGDEVGLLAQAFSVMAGKLRERDIEQARLEREVLEISEAERRRIGHDLHDGLGQRLTAASMGTNALLESLRDGGPDLARRAEEVGRQLRAAIAETRMLSHGLAPVSLEDDGLMAALAGLADSATQAGVRGVFECPERVILRNPEVAGQLYRIAQEAVNNALKHASPGEVRLGLRREKRALILEVDDDGEGFPEENPENRGIGLRVMRYRARTIGAELETGSPPAGGARITCRIPDLS